MGDPQDEKTAALRELSAADRAYRAAFRQLTSAGGVSPSSLAPLRKAVRRLQQATRKLEVTDEQEAS